MILPGARRICPGLSKPRASGDDPVDPVLAPDKVK